MRRTAAFLAVMMMALSVSPVYAGLCGGGGGQGFLGGLFGGGCGGGASASAQSYGYEMTYSAPATSCYSGSYASGPFAKAKARRAARQAAYAQAFTPLPSYSGAVYAAPQSTVCTPAGCYVPTAAAPAAAPPAPSIVPTTLTEPDEPIFVALANLDYKLWTENPEPNLTPSTPTEIGPKAMIASNDYKLWDDPPKAVPITVAMNDSGRLY